MNALELVRLPDLMSCGPGRPEIIIALIDGPVARDLPDFLNATIREIPGGLNGTCTRADSVSCAHGTFVAAMLVARRGSAAPAICPGCTLLVRPIFAERNGNGDTPSATPEQLATAIADSVHVGANIINLSAALAHTSLKGEDKLLQALEYAAQRGSIVVAAAGNQGTLGSSVITRHPWVIPVVACDLAGRPLRGSNLGNSLGKQGVSAPGEAVTSLGTDGTPRTFGGTSVAAPFVSGTVALVWSLFPKARAADVRLAVMRGDRQPRRALVPPVLNAWAAYLFVASTQTWSSAS